MESGTFIPEEPPVPPLDMEIKSEVVVVGGGPVASKKMCPKKSF